MPSAPVTSHLKLVPDDDDLARLERLLIDALRLGRSARPDSRTPSSSPRVLLAEACTIAKQRQLEPEQVILLLKRSWKTLADTEFDTRQDAQEALNRAVTTCIEQYFSVSAP